MSSSKKKNSIILDLMLKSCEHYNLYDPKSGSGYILARDKNDYCTVQIGTKSNIGLSFYNN